MLQNEYMVGAANTDATEFFFVDSNVAKQKGMLWGSVTHTDIDTKRWGIAPGAGAGVADSSASARASMAARRRCAVAASGATIVTWPTLRCAATSRLPYQCTLAPGTWAARSGVLAFAMLRVLGIWALSGCPGAT